MKRVLAFLCAVTMVLTMCSFTLAPTTVAVGTVASPNVDLTTGREIVEVSTFAELKAALNSANNAGKTVKLMADINLNEGYALSYSDGNVVASNGTNTVTYGTGLNGTTAGQKSGEGLVAAPYTNIDVYDGVWFDGNNKTISGFYVDGTASVALFHTIKSKSKIANLNLENFLVINRATAAVDVGLVAMAMTGGEIYNFHIKDSYIICNSPAASSRTRCAAICPAPKGGEYVEPTGAQLGTGTAPATATKLDIQRMAMELSSKSDVIDSCSFDGGIYCTLPGSGTTPANIVGGIVANPVNILITNCSNFADVKIVSGATYGVGGIVGCAEPARGSIPGYFGAPRHLVIINCANYGDVEGTVASERSGAFVGYLDPAWSTRGVATIYNCYNGGTIKSAGAVAKAFVGRNGGGAGAKTYCGETYSPFITAKAALLFSTAQGTTATGTAGGYMTEQKVYQNIALDNIGATVLGETTVLNALQKGSKVFASREWKADDTYGAVLDYSKPVVGTEKNPYVITTADELNDYRDAYNLMNASLDAVYANVKLGADIDLNPEWTFGLDETLWAPTATNGDNTYYFGLGQSDLAAGTWYDSEKAAATPELSAWTPFAQIAEEHLGKIKFDGDGYKISGVYMNFGNKDGGFFGAATYNADIRNLTLDGLVYANAPSGEAAKNVGMFVGTAMWDTYLENCVNEGVVSMKCERNYSRVGGVVGSFGVGRGLGINVSAANGFEDFNSIDHRVERNRRNRNTILACGNRGTVVANSAAQINVGGVVGYASMIKAYLCYNEGQVLSKGSAAPYGVGGVLGMLETGTNIEESKDRHYQTNYGISSGTTNVAAPLQTIIHILGCYNSGRISNASGTANTCGVVGRTDASWFATGAVDFVKDEDGKWTHSETLKSEAVQKFCYNFVNNSQGTTQDVAAGQIWSNDKGFYEGSTEIKDNYRNYDNNDKVTGALDAVKKGMGIDAQLTKSNPDYPTIKDYLGDKADEYLLWIDYKYENGGGLKLIKNPGITVSGTTYTINTPEALALVDETANYAFGKVSVQIGDTVVNNINEAKVLAASLYKAGTGKVMNNGVVKTFEEDTTTSNYTCISNAAIYYMNQAGALGTDKTVWPTTFKGLTLKLGADIDMTGYTWKTMYNDRPYSSYGGTTPDYCFRGIFEGNNKTISGITVNPTGAGDGAAIFGAVNGSSIQNLTVANSTINGGTYTGGLMTYFGGGTVQNVKLASDVTITTTAGNVGGFIAWRQGGTVKDCETAATINAAGATVGGIIGNDNQTVTNCKNTGNITANGTSVGGIIGDTTIQGDVSPVGNINEGTVQGSGNVGGIYGTYRDGAGRTVTMSFDGCKNKGTVIATGNIAGGIVGNVASAVRTLKFENCVNEGTVKGVAFVGGITGSDQAKVYYLNSSNAQTGVVKGNYNLGGMTGQAINSKIENCTNAGLVTVDKAAATIDGHDVGGIAGHIKLNTVIDGCTNTGKVVGSRLFGGIFGDTPAPSGDTPEARVAELQSSTGIVKNCKNLGTMETVARTADGDSYYVGGIGGQACIVIENCENTADVTAKRLVAGIAGRADKDITNCTNKGDVISTGKGAFGGSVVGGTACAGGIVSDYASNNTFFRTISGCVNEGDVSTPEFGGAAGIVTYTTNTTITDCTNKGTISGTALIGGIAAYATSNDANKPMLITKCTNEGAVHSKNGNTGGILGWKNQSRTTVAYCINKGTVTCDAIALDTLRTQGLVSSDKDNKGAYKYTNGALPGGIIGTLNAPTNRLTSTLYGNVNLGKVYTGTNERPNYGITPNAEGYWAYNFSIGATGNGSKGAFLVDGKVVDDEMMRSGLISAIINNINFKEEDFLQKNLWKAANGHYANGGDLIFWGTWTPFAEGSFVQPDGFENGNVMFIDENGYPTLDSTKAAPAIITAETAFEDAMEEFSEEIGEKMSCTIYNIGTEKFSEIKLGETVPANSYVVDVATFAFYTELGASIRKSNPSGLRFETVVSEDYMEVLGISDTATVEFGTIILPKSIAEHALEYNAEELLTGDYQKLDVKTKSFKKEGNNKLSYATSVVNIKDNYRDYVALSYMKITDGDVVTYKTAMQKLGNGQLAEASINSNARSINYVAKQVIENESEAAYAPSIWSMIKRFAVDKAVID